MNESKNNTRIDNTGDGNSGYWNSGYGNSGSRNSGNWNSGNWNSGSRNSGNWNSGSRNSGYWNSGDRNSGYGNSGSRNSGYWNSGDGNSGDGNSGSRNSGYGNSGYGNSGSRNSGYGNSTNRSSGIFCSQEPKLICFNKPTDKKWNEIEHPYFNEFYLNKWIPEEEMTDQEKKDNPHYYVTKGYLKTYDYKEAWSNYWLNCDQDEKNRVFNLPNFDAEVFEDITGINVEAKTCAGKIVEIDGKKYQLQEVK